MSSHGGTLEVGISGFVRHICQEFVDFFGPPLLEVGCSAEAYEAFLAA